MDLAELKREFNILFEEMATAGSKGLDDYEISVCLTNGQEILVRQMLGRYEYGDQLRHALSPLLVPGEEVPISAGPPYGTTYQGNPKVFYSPLVKEDGIQGTNPGEASADESSVLAIVHEFVEYGEGQVIPTIPLDTNDIHYTLENPFRKPDINISYRVTVGNEFWIYSSEDVTKYRYIYCKYPTPIILDGVTETINGITGPVEPVVPETVHRELLSISVQFAIQTYIGQPEQRMQEGG